MSMGGVAFFRGLYCSLRDLLKCSSSSGRLLGFYMVVCWYRDKTLIPALRKHGRLTKGWIVHGALPPRQECVLLAVFGKHRRWVLLGLKRERVLGPGREEVSGSVISSPRYTMCCLELGMAFEESCRSAGPNA